MEKQFTVRKNRKQDCAEVVNMIKELVRFQKEPKLPSFSERDIEKSAISENPAFWCFVCEDESGKLVGHCLIYRMWNMQLGNYLHLEDIYIREDYRDYRLGSAFFKAVSQFAIEKAFSAVTLSCLQWNSKANQTYRRMGFHNVSKECGWSTFDFCPDY